MKHLLKLITLLLAFPLLVSCIKTEAEHTEHEKQTTVFVVRHAEKSNNPPSDPDLTNDGKARAKALKNLLLDKNITAIYSTSYKRAMQTAEPLAQARKLSIENYNAGDLAALAEKVLKEHKNENVLIVGHSNTVLETIEAFKAKRPVSELTDSDYNYLFKVTIPATGNPKAEMQHYGK